METKATKRVRTKRNGVTLSTPLKLDPHNANRHTPESLTAVQLSVARLGAGRSIVADNSGTVIGGEATLKAAQQLGLQLREVHTNGDEMVVVVRDDLGPDDPRRMALAIADNQTAKLSEFDGAVLAEQLRGLGDNQDLLTATGFSDQELIKLLNPEAANGTDAPQDFKEVGEDIETAYCCPKCGYRWSGGTGAEPIDDRSPEE